MDEKKYIAQIPRLCHNLFADVIEIIYYEFIMNHE